MSAVTVENLAKIIGSEGETLLSQMKEAGLSHTDVKDEVTDKDKKILLEFLKEQQNKSSKTISLNKSATKTEPTSSGMVSITRKTITRESAEKQTSEAKRTSSTINFDEIEKKRQAGEANKKAEEELRKKEIEQKTLITRRKAKTGESPVTNSGSKKVVQIEKRTLKPTRAELSKKEQRELEGENFLSNVEKQEFEKPADLISKNIQIYIMKMILKLYLGIFMICTYLFLNIPISKYKPKAWFYKLCMVFLGCIFIIYSILLDSFCKNASNKTDIPTGRKKAMKVNFWIKTK